MPTAWFLPITGTIETIKLEHLHGAFTTWLDRPDDADTGELPVHEAPFKAFSLAPWSDRSLGPGIRINTVDPSADTYLASRTGAGGTIRFGSAHARYRPVVPLEHASWQQLGAPLSGLGPVGSAALREVAEPPLDAPGPANRWEVHFLTPATFRGEGRATALPSVHGILTGLRAKWAQWGPVPIWLTPAEMDAVWVERYDIHSEAFTIRVSGNDRNGRTLQHSGAVGAMLFRCDDPAIAGRVDSLFRLAPYVGVGSRTAWGLGATMLARRGLARPRSARRRDQGRSHGRTG